MADGTPIVTRHQCSQGLPGSKSVRRSGKGMDEFYCQCGFYVMYDSLGNRHSRALVSDIRAMSLGKSAVAMLSFAALAVALSFIASLHFNVAFGIRGATWTFM